MTPGEFIIALILLAMLAIQTINARYLADRLNAIRESLWELNKLDHDRRWEVVKELRLTQINTAGIREFLSTAWNRRHERP